MKAYPQRKVKILHHKPNCLSDVSRSGVREVVPVYRGEDDIVQAPLGDSHGRVVRLQGVEGGRGSGCLDTAEPAASGAGVPHQHDRGGGRPLLSPPALAYIGTPGLLTHCRELQTSQIRFQLGEIPTNRDLGLQPGR